MVVLETRIKMTNIQGYIITIKGLIQEAPESLGHINKWVERSSNDVSDLIDVFSSAPATIKLLQL